MSSAAGEKLINEYSVMGMDSFITPDPSIRRESKCKTIGHKLLSLINDESQQSKWKEFRRTAKEVVSEECTQLLQRMELEDSDDDYDLLDDMNEEVDEMTEGVPLDNLEVSKSFANSIDTKGVMDRQLQKRKQKWGPIERVPRPRRGKEDGKTMMQKA